METTKDINRLKVVLAEKKRTNKKNNQLNLTIEDLKKKHPQIDIDKANEDLDNFIKRTQEMWDAAD